jgi:hypothetical protein
MMLAEGVAVRTIMETLGHSNISMTLDTYAHVMETTLREAATRMDDALNDGRDSVPQAGEEDEGPDPAGVPVRS